MSGKRTRTFEDRFWSKVDRRGPDECWEWLAAVRGPFNSYGVMSGPDGNLLYAHRIAYELLVGPIPDGLVLDHLCRNTRCVNPAHLEPVTNGENFRRSPRVADRTHCPHGHPYDEENTYTCRSKPSSRICRTCKKAWNRGTLLKRKARS